MSKKILFLFSSIFAATLLLIGVIIGSPFLSITATLLSFFLIRIWHSQRLPTEPDFSESEMISMVGLFESIPFLSEEVLAMHVKRAWGIEFETHDEAETFVAGESPLFVIKTEDRVYTVNHFDRPYFDNVEELVDGVAELRMKHVLKMHQGWISVDLMTKPDNLDLEFEYSKIGQLLNQMMDDRALGILVPQYMRLVPWDNSVESAITSDKPLSRLTPSNPPVVPIEDDNPELAAAVSRAQIEWPNFVRAFENHMRDEGRDESRKFAVKTPITVNDQTEHIWVNVTGIENSIIYGTLGNEPVALPGLSEGDRVRTPETKVDDWIYTDGKTMVGGYTIKILAQWATSELKEDHHQ